MINCNTHFSTVKYVTVNSSYSDGDWTLPSQDDEVDIPVVINVAKLFETSKQIPNQPLGPPVEVFTTMASFCWC